MQKLNRPTARVLTIIGTVEFQNIEDFYSYVDHCVDNGVSFKAETDDEGRWAPYERSEFWAE